MTDERYLLLSDKLLEVLFGNSSRKRLLCHYIAI
jgi:hypothetical protein